MANGVPLPSALKILRNVVAEPRCVAALDRLHDQVRNGRRFADALSETDILPALAVRMLRVGDETGDLGGGHLAIVGARYTAHGHATGTIGVIGPTRMDYPRVLPLVAATANAMSEFMDRADSGRKDSDDE